MPRPSGRGRTPGLKGHPPWTARFAELVAKRRRGESGFLVDVRTASGEPLARFFLDRQAIRMPAFRGQLTEEELRALGPHCLAERGSMTRRAAISRLRDLTCHIESPSARGARARARPVAAKPSSRQNDKDRRDDLRQKDSEDPPANHQFSSVPCSFSRTRLAAVGFARRD